MKFQLRGLYPWAFPVGYVYASINENKEGICKFTVRFLAFSNKISTVQKNSAVLEPRTRQFSRTRGFEAKAKDLTFEAKAKDFKMCPQGQGILEDSTSGKQRIEQLIFQLAFKMWKILFFQTTLKTRKMWSIGIKIAIFFKKLQKIFQQLGASPPNPHRWYIWVTLVCSRYLPFQTIFSFLFFYFFYIFYLLQVLPFSQILVACQTMPRLLIFHFTISFSRKSSLFQKCLMTSLNVIWGP